MTIAGRVNVIRIINFGILFLIHTRTGKTVANTYLRQFIKICNRFNLPLLVGVGCRRIKHNHRRAMLQRIANNIFHTSCISTFQPVIYRKLNYQKVRVSSTGGNNVLLVTHNSHSRRSASNSCRNKLYLCGIRSIFLNKQIIKLVDIALMKIGRSGTLGNRTAYCRNNNFFAITHFFQHCFNTRVVTRCYKTFVNYFLVFNVRNTKSVCRFCLFRRLSLWNRNLRCVVKN